MTDINATNKFKAIDSVSIIGNDHKTDFIHMCVKHDAHSVFALPTFGREQVAHCINLDFIGVRLDLFQNDLADLPFVTRHGDDVTKFFEKSELRVSKRGHIQSQTMVSTKFSSSDTMNS